MILSSLIFGIAVMAFLQPSAQRAYSAAVFAFLISMHELIFSHLDGLAYYSSAALTDLFIVALLCLIRPAPRMVIRLQAICLFSILVNAFGWILWFLYLPPTAYNALFVVIYAAALITLMKKDERDVGDFTLNSWRSCFHLNSSKGRHALCQHES